MMLDSPAVLRRLTFARPLKSVRFQPEWNYGQAKAVSQTRPKRPAALTAMCVSSKALS